MFLSILKAFAQLLLGLVESLRYPLYVLLGVIVVWILLCVFWRIHYRKAFKARGKSAYRQYQEPSLFKKLFLLAPRMFILDRLNRPLNFFPVSGLIIYEGRQGSGKTSSMVHELHKLQYQYPKSKCITNFGYTRQNTELDHWSQLIDYKNGYEGVIVAIDELQNWFSSKQSKDFPPEMLSVVTQNRKNRRVIFGTAQNFYMLAKDIRTQCTEIRRCHTFLGVLSIVHCVRPVTNSAGEVEKYKHIRFYCWVHTPEERDSYDTYKAIESLRKSGFIPRSERIDVLQTEEKIVKTSCKREGDLKQKIKN